MTELSTRDKILAYLHLHGHATSAELARYLGLTQADIRYHLQDLIQVHEIESVSRPAAIHPTRGRPAASFQIASQRRPENTAHLAACLLSLCFPSGQKSTETSLDSIQALARLLAAGFSAPAHPTQRLRAAIEYLNQHGYEARWEVHARGPHILFRTCPYRSILSTHPEICQIDQEFLSMLVGVPMELQSQVGKEHTTTPVCRFEMKTRKI